MNNTITIDNVPSGFELTGEYRGPRAGEYFFACDGDAELNEYDCLARYPILRKAWQAPAWMPKGCWLYKAPYGWFVTPHKPSPQGDYHSMTCAVSVHTDDLASLHGETFTPPTHTNCLKIQ